MTDTVYLVGGGPSAEPVLLMEIANQRRHQIIAINDAVFWLPWTVAVFSADARWMADRRDLLLRYRGHTILAVPDGHPRDIAPASASRSITYLRAVQDRPWSQDAGVVALNGTSGFAALNYAALTGARRVVLIGYDYGLGPNGRRHWYDESLGTVRVSGGDVDRWEHWAEHFQKAVPYLSAAGIEVVNTSADSRVTAFPCRRLEELL